MSAFNKTVFRIRAKDGFLFSDVRKIKLYKAMCNAFSNPIAEAQQWTVPSINCGT
jgi:hypothetical protein